MLTLKTVALAPLHDYGISQRLKQLSYLVMSKNPICLKSLWLLSPA
jgi:hypothetical protein